MVAKTEIIITPEELFDLIDEFRRLGYGIGPEQYIAAQDLLVALAAQGLFLGHPQKLRTLLAPILCNSPKEQENFYRFFDQWLFQHPHLTASFREADDQAEMEPVRDTADDLKTLVQRSQPWKWILAATLTLLLIFAAVILFTPKPSPLTRALSGKVLQSDSTALVGAEISLLGQTTTSDSSGFFSFNYGTKDSLAELSIHHSNLNPPLRRWIELNSQHTSPLLIVLPKASTAETTSSEIATTTPHEFVDTTNMPHEFAETPSVPQEFPEWLRIYLHYFEWIRISVTGMPLLIFSLWWAWGKYRRRLLLEKRSTKETPQLDRIRVKGATRRLFEKSAFRRTIQQFRWHREIGLNDLDVPVTVATTIQRGGWFTPVYGARKVLPEYLALIDRVGFRDHQARLLDEIIGQFVEDAVFVDRYYFDGDPRVCWSENPREPQFTLQELTTRHPDHRLIIFSDGAGLMNSLTGRPQRWLGLFSAWRERALLTPESPVHWGYREWALAGLEFMILPASQSGLGVFIETIHTAAPAQIDRSMWFPPYPEMLRERPARWLEKHEPESRVIDQLCLQLRSYLSEEGYYWLSACAVYPTLAWDLTLYLGNRLTNPLGQKLLNEKRLLSLARLPWFRHGSIPDWLRLQLIASLSSGKERAIRQALEDLLLTVLEQPRDGFALDVARKPSGLLTRSWKRLLRDFFKTAPQDGPWCDYVFITYTLGRKPSKLSVTVPNLLRRVLFRQGQAVMGIRPIIAALLMAMLAALGSIASFRLYAYGQASMLVHTGMAELQNNLTIGPDELRPAGHFSLGSSSRRRMNDKESTAETEQTIAVFQQALEQDAENRSGRLGLATSWYFAGNFARADSVIKLLLAKDSIDVEAWNNFGVIAAAAGDSTVARWAFAKALQIRPNYAEAKFNQAIILQRLGRREETKSALQDYLKIDSQSPWSEAIRLRLSAMTELPDSSVVAYMSELKANLERLKIETLKEKSLAERAGSKTLASELFKNGLDQQREGDIKFAAGGKDNFLSAQKAYVGARDNFQKAREQVELTARIKDDAKNAQRDMLQAKQQVPGRDENKRAHPKYTQAVELETTGNRQFQVGDFGAAQNSFNQAKSRYLEAGADIVKGTASSKVDAAKVAMLEAKSKITLDGYSEAKYQQATIIEAEGNSAYSESNFDKAVERYQAARELYVAVARETQEKLAKETDKTTTALDEIQSLINGYGEMLENENLQELKTLYKENEKAWLTFFQVADKIQVNIESNIPSINGKNAEVVLTVQIEYEQRGRKEKSPQFKRRWSLEKKGGKWVIVSMKVQ